MKTLGSIIDPREIIFPMTARKAGFWAAYAGTAALVYHFALSKILEGDIELNQDPCKVVS